MSVVNQFETCTATFRRLLYALPALFVLTHSTIVVAQPNIVMFLVDDLRWDEISAAGHEYVRTPNIDRIAANGAYFQNSFTTTPLCSPARASFLTGQYTHRHGIFDNLGRNEQSHNLDTFPRRLDADGYETAFIGKWHMGNDDTPRPGFDYWAGMKGQGEALDPEFNINGERRQFEGYVTDIMTDMALDFIERQSDVPFVLYLSHKALHPNITQLDDGSSVASPSGVPGFIAAERHRDRYAGQEPTRRPSYGITPDDKPALMRRIGDLPTLGPDTVTPDKTIWERQAMLMAVDDNVGAVLDAIDEAGIRDNTVVVFASDHGYWYGEHGLGAERRLAYEEGIRIPLMIRYPGKIAAGSRPDQLVLSIDVAPTLLELAGSDVPDTIQGRSLVPLFAGPVDRWRNAFLIEYYTDTVFERMLMMGYKAVRTDRYKLIQYMGLEGANEFYDLDADPYELENQFSNPEFSTTIKSLQQTMGTLVLSAPN